MSALARLVLLALLASGCGDASLEGARDRGLAYFRGVEAADVSWAYLAPYLETRFGVALELAGGSPVASPGGAPAPFQRLFSPESRVRPDAIAALESPVDRILAAALYCDSLGLPPDWSGILRRATDRGGYGATHAVLALAWSVENGCVAWVDAGALRHHQVEALVAILGGLDAAAEHDDRALDVWVEALALLYYADARSRVEPGWLDALAQFQRADGGWAEHPRAERSSPHTTAFALWALSEALEDPAAPRTPMLPR